MIKNVPTNIITGFLGTGKTSAIHHLLQFKPEGERWAVIVNEFGEVGLDGQLYQNSFSEEAGVYIRAVPGGCMCCTSGIPMQIALNVLLKRSRPHRLLIEPSGLGHPVEVVSLLFSKYYKGVLNIQKTVALIDSRHLDLQEYKSHPTFKQQIQIADILVANKSDLCSTQQLNQIEPYLESLSISGKPIHRSEFGQIDPDLLLGKTSFNSDTKQSYKEAENQVDTGVVDEAPIPKEQGFIKSTNSGEGYESVGWRYNSEFVFDKKRLLEWFKSLKSERIKAIIHSDEGICGFNFYDGCLQEIEIKQSNESRIEIISKQTDESWEDAINLCIIKRS